MPNPRSVLTAALQDAMGRGLGPEWATADPVLRPATNPRFGDYQANAAMALAGSLGRPPRELAALIVEHLDAAGLVQRAEIAGPGFVNLTLDGQWLGDAIGALRSDDRLGVAPVPDPETVIVDYSGPNVAKEMHIGHLRSTCIGDSVARTLAFLGHAVIRQNHLGDWGTQFGMLIEHLEESGFQGMSAGGSTEIRDLDELYREAQGRFESDPAFADRARRRVVALQSGEPRSLELWRNLVAESERHFRAVYERLGVLLTDDDIRGESFYNERLPELATELEAAGLAVVDDGALCVFVPGATGRDGAPLPLIVRKADGGFGYAATDLAALRYRTATLGATRIAYVVDARQSQHFSMVFAVGHLAGWLGGDRRAEHVAFGTVLGADGRPFRTRAGGTVKLAELLDEAVARAAAVVADKNPELSDVERDAVARAVGIGAVKYADLSSDRVKDYVFDWDRMLAFDGNTAPYLQYAYVRVRSIFRRAGGDSPAAGTVVTVEHAAERALALLLLQFPDAVEAAADGLAPHRLCTYLFELAQAFTRFFEACPVLRAGSDDLRDSRLSLCDATARVLACGLSLLGVDTVEHM